MEDVGEAAQALKTALDKYAPKIKFPDGSADLVKTAESVQKPFRPTLEKLNQDQASPVEVGKAFVRYRQLDPSGMEDQSLKEIGESLRQFNERIGRRYFYWGLSDLKTGNHQPKVDTGVRWFIQDFEDPGYRGPAEWNAIVFDRERFSPREAGYAFMTDPAGYNLPAHSAQVKEFMRNNNYYRGSKTAALGAGSLIGSVSPVWSRHRPAEQNTSLSI